MSETGTATSTEGPEPEGASKYQGLGWPDLVVILLYFGFVIGVGIWSSRRTKGSASGYFLASRSMHWLPVGASLFASNIGSGHFIGLAGSGAASGIGVGGFELSAIYVLMLLGWVFVPVYMSSGVFTMPEYLRERFGGQRIRVYLSFLALMLYVFTKISADLYAGALFIQLALNRLTSEWLYLSILILLGVAALFTIAGGLSAVIWTDFVQTVLMIVGSFVLMVMSLNAVGGYQQLVDKFPYATATVRAKDLAGEECGAPPSDYMHLLRSPEPGVSDLPWTGMVFGLTINSIWYWCTDQVIVQRTLASKNMIHAKGGCILAAWLKFLPLWLLVFPGMAARILFPERVACADPVLCTEICGSEKGCSNIAYAELVIQLLPTGQHVSPFSYIDDMSNSRRVLGTTSHAPDITGMAGMMLAVMLAALMSSLTSIFNSASTIFTIDVWSKFRKRASDTEKIIVGRCFVIVLVIISIIWIPVIQNSGSSQLFEYIQSISSFLAPPICAVYLLAIFWERTNEPGAFYGLMVGLVIGLIRFGVEFSYLLPACGTGQPDPRPAAVKMLVGNVHYLHFSCFLWLITIAVTVSVSLLSPPIPQHCLYRLTWSSRKDVRVRCSIAKYNREETTPLRENYNDLSVQDPVEESPLPNILKKLCCAGQAPQSSDEAPAPVLTEEVKAKEAAEFLNEEPFWKEVVNVNAVICLVLSTFVIAFYA
ncbi:Sodium/solute symporter [Trinorchestia longiramus]|nr:Sodium/solute symporter [Trinorchestia longiramus]